MVVLVAACADQRGILIEVKSTDESVVKLRLFVGAGTSTTSNLTIAGPHRVDRAIYYARDPQDRGDVVDLTTGPRVAKFAYETHDDIPLVIAVGYDAADQPVTGGVLHDLAAPTQSNHVNAYEIDLDTSAQVAVFGTNGAVQLGLWSSQADTAMDPYSAQCAGIQVGTGSPAYFVVNPDDQDCDGYLDGSPKECAPNVYDGSTAADPSRPECLVAPLAPAYCYVGGKGCTDGVGTDSASACAPTHICLPRTVCDTCASNFSCAADLDGTGHTGANETGLHFACSIQADQGQLCDTTLRLARPPTAGYGCSDFQIGNAGFGSTLTSGGMQIDATGGKDTDASSCDAFLVVKHGAATPGVQAFSGLASYTLANNGGVAIPIEFSINDSGSGCSTQAIDCQLVNELAAPSSDQSQCAGGWGASQVVTGVTTNTGSIAGVTLTPDGLRMFYAAGGVLYTTTRSAIDQPWGASTKVGVAPSEIRAPKLSADGRSLIFAARPNSTAAIALYSAPVSSAGAVGTATAYANSGPNSRMIESATFTPDPMSLIVEEFDPNDSSRHLYLVPVTAAGVLGDGVQLPVSMASHNFYDRQPSLSADGLHLYFASDRDNFPSIYVSSRATLNDDFTLAVAVKELIATDPYIFPFVTHANDEVYYGRTAIPGGVAVVVRATRGTLP